MFKNIFIVIFFFTVLSSLQAQDADSLIWNNKRCAVVLSYDDALDVHLDNVIPYLDSNNLKGTFYIVGKSKSIKERHEEWRKASEKGHELGNHTMFHPCFGKSKGRAWVNEYDLDNYTFTRLQDEILVCNTLLNAIDGKQKRTFAFTCGDIDFENARVNVFLQEKFAAARGTNRKLNLVNEFSWFNVNAHVVRNVSADELIEEVKKAMKDHALLVFCFHGVGGGHSINIELEEHNSLVDFLKQYEDEIWTTTMLEVAEYFNGTSARCNGSVF